MKKLFSILAIGALLTSTISAPIYASEAYSVKNINNPTAGISAYSSNYFSGITGKMNSLNGKQSRVFNISSGSIDTTAKVTNVTVNVTVSSGSSPFYLLIENPSGQVVEKYVSKSGSISVSDFKNTSAKGTWKLSIVSNGLVSTATARMIVNYNNY